MKRLSLTTAVLVTVFLTGCSSVQMKGTPFYTGEYEVRRGPVEDRINGWPLLYYREPALSVLWPIGELTEDHLAVRPLMSVYGLHTSNRVYNVLWPLAQFDTARQDHRIFPVYWGQHHAAVFPLYWHFTNSDNTRLTDGLFPAWWYHRSPRGKTIHVMMPIFNYKNTTNEKGWRVWPLVGDYAKGKNNYSFLLWPLGHKWTRREGEEKGHMFIPIYYAGRGGEDWAFLTPLFCRGGDIDGPDNWSLLFPVYYNRESEGGRTVLTLAGGYSRDGDESRWLCLPLLSGGHREADEGSTWIAGGLAHRSWGPERQSRHVLPLFYQSREGDYRTFLSLPWSHGTAPGGRDWTLAFPFFYRGTDGNRQTLVTPAFAAGSDAEAESAWHSVFPLYYKSSDSQEKTLATLLGGYTTDKAGHRWLLYPLLSGGKRDEQAGQLWVAAPIFHARWDKEGTSQHLLPLYYWNSKTQTLVSPFAARWDASDGRHLTVVPPLLSWMADGEQRDDLWALGGLAHLSWGSEAGSRHLFPIFYSNPRRETFISPLAARWKNQAGQKTTAVPPLLSWRVDGETRDDLWALGGLAHLSWGPDAGSRHVFPVFYADPRKDTFISPVAATWRDGSATYRAIPLLLSGSRVDGKQTDTIALLGLFHNRWGATPAGDKGHLLPFYYYEGSDRLLTPVFGWDKDKRDGFVYPLTPLAGVRRGDYTGSWLFPIYSHKRHKGSDRIDDSFLLWGEYGRQGKESHSSFFPLYSYQNHGAIALADEAKKTPGTYGKRLNCLGIMRYQNELQVSPQRTPDVAVQQQPSPVRTHTKKHGVFPLWSYSGREMDELKRRDVDANLLFLLYDHKQRVFPDSDQPETLHDYTRKRILWRLWHYEKSDGDVSVDAFPFITYDRKQDGFRKTSFLWRFFRYERSEDSQKLDLLFVPLIRKQGAATDHAGSVRDGASQAAQRPPSVPSV